MLPNIQKVELCVQVSLSFNPYDPKLQYWIDRMANYLTRMKNLKYLNLSNRGAHSLPLLSKLNSFENMLNRPEVVKLNFILVNRNDFPNFQALLKSKTLLKHLTSLKLNLPEDDKFFEVFQLLPDACPRLLSLDSPVKTFTYPSKTQEVSYWQCFRGFQNLQRLSLNCGPKFDSFRYYRFPTSLRCLDLRLDDNDAEWKSLLVENSPITAFHSEQEGLENLEKLQIFLKHYHPTEEKEIVRAFLEDLLRRISALKDFCMEFCPQHHMDDDENTSYPFDISQFLSGFQHLSHSLERLTLIDIIPRNNFTDFKNTQAFQFPELSYLYIIAKNFSSLPVLENILKVAQAKPERPTPYVKLESVKIDSCKALSELFSSLKKISGRHIELVILFNGKMEDSEYFKENYEEVKKDSSNLRNVNLETRFLRECPMWFRWGQELKSFEKLFGKFVVHEKAWY